MHTIITRFFTYSQTLFHFAADKQKKACRKSKQALFAVTVQNFKENAMESNVLS